MDAESAGPGRRLVTRREFGGLSLAASIALGEAARAAAAPENGVPAAAGDALDAALDLLAPLGPASTGRLANHAPMAAEALYALGRPEEALPWVERYKGRLAASPPPGTPIPDAAVAAALGREERLGDWRATFDRALAEAPFAAVLGTWLPRLTPGFGAAAAHGAIRTAHAARAIALKETKARRQELSFALAYWASQYETLPRARREGGKRLAPAAALRSIETLRPSREPAPGNIVESLRTLATLPSFADVTDLLILETPAGATLSDLTALFTHLYLAQGRVFPIAFLHGVTSLAAARVLLPFAADAGAAEDVVRASWQTAAAIYATFGTGARLEADLEKARAETEKKAFAAGELVERAVRNGDEHAIKLTEVCLRENALRPSWAFLAAASDGIDRL